MTKPTTDRHAEQVKADLRMAGTSLARVIREAGLPATAGYNALRSAYYGAEKAIATALNKKPGEIWPSRYMPDLMTPRSHRVSLRQGRQHIGA